MTDERTTVTIRRCRAEDVNDVLAFIDAYWKPGHIFTRHRGLFDWQHALHDHPGEYSIAIARRTADRTLLGILGYIPTRQFDSSIAENTVWLALWKVRDDAGSAGLGLQLLTFVTNSEPHTTLGVVGFNAAVAPIYRALGFTVGELRHMLEKGGGNLASTNAVAWMFNKKGYIVVEKTKADEEKLMAAVLEAGADDMQDDDDNWEVLSTPESFQAVRDAVKGLGIEPASAQVSMIPQNYVKLEGKVAQQMLKLMEALDDQDDVQHVWSNFDISEQEIEASLA